MRGSNKTYLKVISNLLTALVILALCVFILPKIIIFFMPFLLIAYWQKRKFSILQFLLIPITMFVTNIPAVIAGCSPMITFTKYIGLTTECPWLYYYYPNIWFFYQIRPYYRFGTCPILLTVVVLMIFVILLVKNKIILMST